MYKLVLLLLLLSIATAQDIQEYITKSVNDASLRASSTCATSTYEPNVRIRVMSVDEIRVHENK